MKKYYKSFNEFKDDLLYLRTHIQIPALNQTVDKAQFITKGVYDTNAEEIFLEDLYNKRCK